MGLFKKEKKLVEWTDKTAPAKKQIQLECSFELYLKSTADSYSTYNDRRVCKNELKKALLVNTDSDKDSIKEEIAAKLEQMYSEICEAIDNDSENFSINYWENKLTQVE